MDFLVETSNLISFLQSYIGKTDYELANKFSINTSSKAKNFVLCQLMCFSYKGKGNYLALAEHENIRLKTIQLKENGKPKEAMSFPTINYLKIVNEEWDNSDFKKYISSRFLFFVFKKEKNKNYLTKIFLWKMPIEDLNGEVFEVWKKVKDNLISGDVISSIEKNGKIKTFFPSEALTKICHVRPHGANGADLVLLPAPDKKTGYTHMSKQSFWFNHSYLEKILKNS